MSATAFAQKQGQAFIDSLLRELPKAKEDTNKVKLLNELGAKYNYTKPDEGIKYAQQGMELATRLGYRKGLAHSCKCIGSCFALKRDAPMAIEYYWRCLKAAEDAYDRSLMSASLFALGKNFQKIAEDSGKVHLPDSLARFSKIQLLNRAVGLMNRAIFVQKEMGDLDLLQASYNQLAQIQTLLGDADGAKESYKQHSKYLEGIYNQEKSTEVVKSDMQYVYGKKQEKLKEEGELKDMAWQKRVQQQELKNLYEKKQSEAKTEIERQAVKFEYDLNLKQLEIESAQKQAKAEAELAKTRTEQEKKEAIAAEHLKQEQKMIVALSVVAVLMLIIAITAAYAYRQKRKDHMAIAKEKQRSEALLLNILPAEVAEELKEKGSAAAKYFDDVTVIFTDFVGFTKAGERMSPQELVNELDTCFKAFDGIMAKYGIEKIKTVGDAYLAVAGLPLGVHDHARNMVSAAIEILHFMVERKKTLGDGTFEIRIGVHTGSVVAGIVGVRKFAYDIWGDTVNTAARMEQSSEPGKINISQTTYELVKDKFACVYRGEIHAKNKGGMKMYFISC
jgi:class 3 adenylate cyclase